MTVINPGFVDTPLNASYDPKKKLFVMSKERCARKILEKLPSVLADLLFRPRSRVLEDVREPRPYRSRWCAGYQADGRL
ncbi:MAG: hypothetical protein R3D30_07420 [Hyphomicrobiales bacterium]